MASHIDDSQPIPHAAEWEERIAHYLRLRRRIAHGDQTAITLVNELEQYGWDAIFLIGEHMVHDRRPDTRIAGGEILLRINYQRAVAQVLPLLRDADAGVRGEICGTLHDLGDAQAADAVMWMLLNDEDGTNRHIAAYTLGRIGMKSALAILHWVAAHDQGTDWEGRSVAGMAREFHESILERLSHDANSDEA
jgi:HEAT repeat protein